MKKIFLFGLAVILIAGLNACSTILNTTTQQVELISNPPNAVITVDGLKFGTSPQKVNIERGINHTITFELDGYQLYETQLTRKISFWFWGNALNGFLPGMAIDFISGSMYNIVPDKLEVELSPAKVEQNKKKK